MDLQLSDLQLLALAAYCNFVWILLVSTVVVIHLREPIIVGSKEE
jgi:hypothetical protein